MKQTHIFVIYDGIENSVFPGQVLQPLCDFLSRNPEQNILLISFEKNNDFLPPPSIQFLFQKSLPSTPSYYAKATKDRSASSGHNRTPLRSASSKRLELLILKKNRFLGQWSLYPAIWQLKKVLKQHQNFTVTARGPLAGYVTKQALGKPLRSCLTVQARGLLAEEYKFVNNTSLPLMDSTGLTTNGGERNSHSLVRGELVEPYERKKKLFTKNIFLGFLYLLRARQYKQLEKKVYGTPGIKIEAVSPALGEFLQKEFGTKKNQISIAKQDIPKQFQPAQITSWKKEIREKLQIPVNSCVYCFNGSAKPWQCPEQVVTFFKKKLEKKSDVFLLVLTQQKKEFQQILRKKNIPEKNYLVITVAHKEIYKYLSACDVGLLFREPHVVNWVSRPTKVLEYQAVGLEVVHNNTVEWMTTDTPAQSHKTTVQNFPHGF